MIATDLHITDDFPPISFEEWKKATEADLKGVPFAKKLVTHNYDGIDIQPLFTSQDCPTADDPAGFPGTPPFTRGARPIGCSLTGWQIRQEILQAQPSEANRTIREELNNGVTAIHLKLDAAACAGFDGDSPQAPTLIGRQGVMLYCLEDFDRALADVNLEETPLVMDAGGAFLPAAGLLIVLLEKRGVDLSRVQVGFNADPLGAWLALGSLPFPLKTALGQMASLAAWTEEHLPQARAVQVSGDVFHHGGASSTQDLAFVAATAVEYLRSMTSAGLDLQTAVRQISFHLSIGCRFFEAIAKLRALRTIWAKIIAACQGDPKLASGMRITVETSRRVLTRRDPWVNLLRNTACCFAGAVGGADAITTLPLDAAFGGDDPFHRHLARNTQLILLEECHLHRVLDPAGGSWFLETLTRQMAEKAWTIFQELETRGGMLQAAATGWVSEQIQRVEEQREKDLATRKAAITGVSEHSDVDEQELPVREPDYAQLLAQTAVQLPAWRQEHGDPKGLQTLKQRAAQAEAKPGELVSGVIDAARQGATLGQLTAALNTAGLESEHVAPVAIHPYAAAYEELREAADAITRDRGGKRPTIFLANLGVPKEFLARATYAQNFFAAGGFAAVTNDGFTTPEATTEAFAKSKAKIAVICSTDLRYQTEVEKVAPMLKAAGARDIVLAGNPGAAEAKYRAAGVTHFIYIKCNVLEVLRAFLKEEGVSP